MNQNKMIEKLMPRMKNKRGQLNVVNLVIGFIIGLLVLALVIFAVIAAGSSIINSSALTPNSIEANQTTNVFRNLTTASANFATNFTVWLSMLGIVVLIVIIALLLFYVRRFAGAGGGGGL